MLVGLSTKSAVLSGFLEVGENRAPYTVLRLYKTPRRRSRAPSGEDYKFCNARGKLLGISGYCKGDLPDGVSALTEFPEAE